MCALSFSALSASEPVAVADSCKTPCSPWNGKKVAVLGDSMSDPEVKATTLRYYDYLSELIGIEPLSYATNGYRWQDLLANAERLYAEHGDDIDAVIIWAGTNDFNTGQPLGEFFVTDTATVDVGGGCITRLHRTPVLDKSTFSGSINLLMSFLKEKYPTKQILILTPVHRAFADFGGGNVQQNELYANSIGLFIDDYVHVLKRAGEVWSVPVIDLFSISGLYPVMESNDIYVADPVTDRLHLNDNGHYRIARVLQQQLNAFPALF